MTYDFKGLTDTHGWLILYQGWSVGQKYPDGSDWIQPSPRQVKKLIDRGMMEEVQVQYGMMMVKEYRVYADVHFQWCLHCEKYRKN